MYLPMAITLKLQINLIATYLLLNTYSKSCMVSIRFFSIQWFDLKKHIFNL